MYQSTKLFRHLASAYRNHNSDSDCYMLHGYCRDIYVTFGATSLDKQGFVVDFGGLKEFKRWLEDKFDHTTVLQADDPLVSHFRVMESDGFLKLTVLPIVSCEGWAMYISKYLDHYVQQQTNGRAYVLRLEVRENDKNSAIYVNRIIKEGGHDEGLAGTTELEHISIDNLHELTRDMEHGSEH